ncbi:MAG: high-affinity zinc transporter membrane component [Candidatus Methanofastidiosum methylothiophilum]|uniref:High-affinity zinc transporter membrane component n=1 Tax=Candidatus Methanofastidiosum methylothiophilum TaxID=1705564 RepID=A0A150J836_9EURY|nr:MAG: high-affinity zinc transporter membrane component [Candidatus Methanofastidiosum methylthiophilus]NMC77584.1 metal ABC transporter permease [Candidatus Methanofastidiosa archaeon]
MVFEYAFFQNAIMAGVLAAIACGIIGSYVVVKRLVFISGGISHAAFGGIGLGLFLGYNPLLVAILFSVFSSSILGIISRKAYQREDTLIGAMWAIGMAFGIFMIYQTPGYVPDLASYLFGNILTVSRQDIFIMLILNIIIGIVVFSRYNEFLAFSFDEEFSEVTNVPVMKTYIILLSLVALTVVILVSVVGIILAMALLTLPAATASLFTNSLKKMIILSLIMGIIYMLLGIGISFLLDQPSGATIVLISGVSYLILLGIKSLILKNN